jgi:transposase
MGRFIKIQLDDHQRKELEKGCRTGKSHAFRTRCQMVLLKSEGRKSKEIASFFGFCQQAVNSWLKRYKTEGVGGLKVKEGRGRPTILSKTDDLEAVKKAVKKHRQRILIAKAELEETLGKEFSARTLGRYLKILTVDINEFHDV